MYTIVLALHIFVCFLLIIAVLLQNGKGTDVASALGGGTGEMFGPKAPASIMNKITTIIAACFLILSLTLAVLSGLGSDSVLKSVPTEQLPPATAAPSSTSGSEPLQINLGEPANTGGSAPANTAPADTGVTPTIPSKAGNIGE